MWQCPKCKREFIKPNQSHSCVSFPIENHFKNKEAVARLLFDALVNEIEHSIGLVKIESLPCCIHLVSDYTFGAVWAMKDKIRIDFRISRKLDDPRISKQEKLSANRFLYYIDLESREDIDGQLIDWIKESYFLKN